MNVYTLPIALDQVTNMGRDSIAHVGDLKHAIDFDTPEGTPIFAAANGVVIFVKDDSMVGGVDPAFEHDGNYIEILHAHNEVSEYEHLRHASAKVNVGDVVVQGTHIAEVGNTGWSECPHLHFMVYPKDRDSKTLKIRFQDFPL